jgi:hypothetical protein
VCVEVAEHLPASGAPSFVADLARLAPVVAFSAAIPGQGGEGHVNEQWPEYWERLFAASGYRVVDALRRPFWRHPDGPAYVAQNLLLAVDAGGCTATRGWRSRRPGSRDPPSGSCTPTSGWVL